MLAGGLVPSAQTAPQASQPPNQPTFRVSVDLVTLDVIPRDPRGQFLSNLGKDDFEVFEDSVRQEIASLTLVHGGRVFDVQVLAPPVQEGVILPSTRSASQPAGRIFLIVVDLFRRTVSSHRRTASSVCPSSR